MEYLARVSRGAGIEPVAPDLQPAAAGLAATTFDDYLRAGACRPGSTAAAARRVGASLGGLLAMACAAQADALVLVNPLPPSPWCSRLPARDWPDVVPWRRDARLASTRRAIAGCGRATALFAFRQWRDESGAVLRAAHQGIEVRRDRHARCCALCRRRTRTCRRA